MHEVTSIIISDWVFIQKYGFASRNKGMVTDSMQHTLLKNKTFLYFQVQFNAHNDAI